MLNNDDRDGRELDCFSPFFDSIGPLARESDPHFFAFSRKSSGKLNTHSAGFGVWSDWPELNDLCV